MPPPAWALAERQLLALNAEGVALWAGKYLDANGHLRGVPNFGIEDGPDDAVESIRNWPLAHAAGGPESIIELWDKAWEGHLDQYSKAKDPSTEIAKEGMYFKEFPPSYDWEHIGEGLGPFLWSGLSRPDDERYQTRLRRFAGFYLNEDPEARNYDAKLKLIPSLFNGSRGAKLSHNTQEDWNGRLIPGTKPSTRFLKATNILGDHPLNLASTNLAFHAYLVTHEAKYRNWLLEYVDAWKARIEANGGNIPSNIGRDGDDWWRVGREMVRRRVRLELARRRRAQLRAARTAGSVRKCAAGDRQSRLHATCCAGRSTIFTRRRKGERQILLPRYYGDNGWYGFHDGESGSPGGLSNLREVEMDIYMWALEARDLERLPKRGWIGYLHVRRSRLSVGCVSARHPGNQRAAARLRADTTRRFPASRDARGG